MARLIVSRLLQLPVLLWVIYTVTFVLTWQIPGSPLEQEGRRPDPAIIEAMEAQYNLDDGWTFYGDYLQNASGIKWAMAHLGGIGSATGDTSGSASGATSGGASGGVPPSVFYFGPSLQYRDWTVNEIIARSLPVSLQLGLGAILLALLLGTTAGVLGAVNRDGPLDVATLGLALVGISLPTFVTGGVLLAVFAVWWPVLPVGGWGRPGQMILPTITLSLPFAAYIARLTRMGMIDVLSSDFIRTARAKGVSGTRLVTHHAVKVAFLPVLSFLGPAAAAALTGSFVVEKVFNVPGMGEHFVDAVRNKDIFLIMGVVLVYATLLILFNLLVDLAYAFVDPRIDAG